MKNFSGFSIFALLLSVSISLTVHSQADLPFEHLTTKQGLSVNGVLSICQDREGFMWFGTEDGLNKYDGYSFTIFKHDPDDPKNSLRHGRVTCIYEDRAGRLWLATIGGLHQFDKHTGKATSYQVSNGSAPDSISRNVINCIYQDGKGVLWLGGNGAITLFDPDTKKYRVYVYPVNSNNENVIKWGTRSITEDASGRLWVGSTKGLFQFDRKTQRLILSPLNVAPADPQPVINVLYADAEGLLLMGTDKGLFKIETGSLPLRALPYPANGKANAINKYGILDDKKGKWWLGTTDGLQQIDRSTGNVVTYRFDASKPGTILSNNIGSLYQDRTGNIWMGTDNGINKINAYSRPFTVFQFRPSSLLQPQNRISGVLEDSSGSIWLSTAQGLFRLDSNLKQTDSFSFNPADLHSGVRAYFQAMYKAMYQAMYQDRQGRLWMGTQNGLQLLNPSTRSFTVYPFPDYNYYKYIKEDPSGKLWIGGERGLVCFDPATKKYQDYDHDFHNVVTASRTGDIWIGSGDIRRLNQKTGKMTIYRYSYDNPGKQTINSSDIRDFYEDHEGVIWVGTSQGGLNRFEAKNSTFTYYSTREGLPANFVEKIVEDDKGNLWLGTTNGICRFNYKDKSTRNFDESDGLPNNDIISACRGRNNKLFFGTKNGLVIFYPDRVKDNPQPPPVHITGFSVLGQPMFTPDGTITLSHTQNYLSFDFVALNYNSPEKNQYAYKLEGLDKDWVNAGTRRYAGYTNLKPGRYTFRVKASNNNGMWNEQGATFSITINPPWWQTVWAYVFYGLCCVAGLVAIDRIQRRRLLRKERERAKERELQQAKEIEKAYRELKATQSQLIQSEKMASLGELTAGIAHEIQNPLNFVNNFSDVSNELIDEMKEELATGNTRLATEIADDIKQNLEKIAHHGKRADSIVKGMLQHSRSSTGQKEPTDINVLCDEYLRLSYHGLRAKDKSFNAAIKTDFDESIGKINIVPQDAGRVILNLLNNAFYAVNDKKRSGLERYEPTVSLSTKGLPGKVVIRVSDNGSGIPPAIVDKIFQPFFTTKSTGQGTGLGLSMSYDIVTKGHGGELTVETREGEGTDFVITLPV